jgi:signal peptidase II
VSSPRARAWLRMLVVCGLVIALDQAVKAAIVASMEPGERTDLALGFELARVMNSGIAFGLFSDGSDGLVLLFTSGALALIVGWFALDTTRPWLWLGVGLLSGGALGNLADRIRDGAVTDFLDPPLWPAFNLADVAITLGVVVIALAAMAPSAEPASEP